MKTLDIQFKTIKYASKRPHLLSDYTYTSVQSMSSVKQKNNVKIESTKEAMRICSHAYPVEWSTTENPQKLLDVLKGLLPQLNLE